jgi:flagellar hook-associated protein 1 FlgK
MSVGLVLNVAKEALLAQRGALDVISHNIANVNTPGYSKQIPILSAIEGSPYAGKIFGRGVNLDEVLRNTDSFVETRLRDRQSDLSSTQEKEIYMSTIEGLFGENTENGLSTQLVDFWNAWYDLSNNPSGMPEREIITERGALLSQAFQSLSTDLTKMQQEIDHTLSATLDTINGLTEKIADLNGQIVSMQVSGEANDLMDKRNEYVKQLSEYLDVKAYEGEDGNMTVSTGRGYLLVSKTDHYQLSMNGDQIQWESSGGGSVPITDTIAGGKLGGWLDVRDQIIPKYQADMDEMAKAIIWQVNQAHSQGVGLNGFSSVTSTALVTNPAEEVGTAASGLSFYDKVQDGSFKIWLYDSSGALVGGTSTTIPIDADGTTLNALAADLTTIDTDLGAANVFSATVNASNKLVLTASNGYTFAFSGDTSNVLAALGINTFFTGDSAATIDVNPVLDRNSDLIAAGRVGSNGEIAAGDNTNALALSNLQYQSAIIRRWTYARGETATASNVNGTIGAYLSSFESSIGIASQSAQRLTEFNQSIFNTLSQARDSVSAVSLDEEMTNLIKYQHAYTAAAKLVTTSDQMLTDLINMKSAM